MWGLCVFSWTGETSTCDARVCTAEQRYHADKGDVGENRGRHITRWRGWISLFRVLECQVQFHWPHPPCLITGRFVESGNRSKWSRPQDLKKKHILPQSKESQEWPRNQLIKIYISLATKHFPSLSNSREPQTQMTKTGKNKMITHPEGHKRPAKGMQPVSSGEKKWIIYGGERVMFWGCFASPGPVSRWLTANNTFCRSLIWAQTLMGSAAGQQLE